MVQYASMEGENYLSFAPITEKNHLFPVILGILGIGIVAFVLYKVVSINTIPQSFLDTYSQIDSQSKSLLASSVYDFAALNKANQEQDTASAYQFVASGVVQTKTNETQLGNIEAKTLQLKKTSLSSVSDSLGKNILKLYNLLSQRNNMFESLFLDEAAFFSAMKTNYEVQAKGQQAQLPDVNTMLSHIQQQLIAINNLNFQIDSVYQDILKASGNDRNSNNQTLPLGSSSLTVTPYKAPPQFLLPTLPPTPTPIPSPTQSASPTATPNSTTPTASPSASPH